jgi:hypothetical protein
LISWKKEGVKGNQNSGVLTVQKKYKNMKLLKINIYAPEAFEREFQKQRPKRKKISDANVKTVTSI